MAAAAGNSINVNEEEKPWPAVPISNKDRTSAAVVIVGAGVSGICMAIDLLRRNDCQNFVILEKSGGLGGTWRDNAYPGCCCDVFSMLYSFSFAQNPDWTRLYPGQEEILDYLVKTAEQYNLFKYIRFNSEVVSASWDDAAAKWNLRVKIAQGTKDSEFNDEYTMSSDFFVSAIGQLNVPKYPNIPGLDSFTGKAMHSARWDWTYSLKGKRVAIIGNGASAAQIIPELAKEVAQLTVYQRSPNWVVPRMDSTVSPAWKALLRYIPGLQSRLRAGQMDFREGTFGAFSVAGSADAEMFKNLCLDQMHAAFPGQEKMWDALTPEYQVGCKRVLISDDYYSTLAMPHVTLETRAVKEFTPKGIKVTSDSRNILSTPASGSQGFGLNDDEVAGSAGDEEFEYDLIVLATGFKTLQFMHPIDVTGRHGQKLTDIWKKGPESFLSLAAPELPNFGALYFVNANLGHNSIILMIEAQTRYIAALIQAVLAARLRDTHSANRAIVEDTSHRPTNTPQPLSLVPKPARVQEYNEKMQKNLESTAWADKLCGSWYKDPVTGKITNNWSGTVVEYQKLLECVDWSDWEGGEEVVKMKKEAGEVLDIGDGSGKPKTWIGRVREETYISDPQLMTILGTVAVSALALGGWMLRNGGRIASSVS